MKAPGRIRAALLIVALAMLPMHSAGAQSSNYLQLSEGEQNRSIRLGLNKSAVVDLPRAAGDVLVSNPEIADAVLRTSTRLYLIGMEAGQASVFLFDAAGEQITSFDVYVELDLSGLNNLLAEAISDGYVRAEAIDNSIVLRGQVASSTDASRAEELARQMLPTFATSVTNSTSTTTPAVGGSSSTTTEELDPATGPQIVNLLAITGEEQVALKVTIAELQREVVKQLGINLQGSVTEGGFTAGSADGLSPVNFPFNPIRVRGDIGIGYEGPGFDFRATLEALEETRMLRTLAEPTLTAVSGETANFLAGGEFPVPVGADDGEIKIEFKEFGVNLAFTPVVLSAGRISLKIRTSVSELSSEGAISVPLTLTDTVTIPALATRRAETSIELPSGGAFAMAGLIREDTRRAISGFPALQHLPILGALFSSKDFLQDETELVMIVTPYIVKPTAPQELTRPDENLMMADDAEGYLLNRLTEVYGRAKEQPAGGAAPVGFTFD